MENLSQVQEYFTFIALTVSKKVNHYFMVNLQWPVLNIRCNGMVLKPSHENYYP
jgi:hypothetical protein